MATKATETAVGRVKALLGFGWLVSPQERKDILDIVEALETRVRGLEAELGDVVGELASAEENEHLHPPRIQVLDEVYDRINEVMHQTGDSAEPIAAYWIGACSAVVLNMKHEEARDD